MGEDYKVSIEYNTFFSFFKKYWHLIGLVCIIVALVFVRSQINDLPLTDDWAEMTINQNVMTQFRSQVSSQYPNLPYQNQEALVEDMYKKFHLENGAELSRQTELLSLEYKKIYSYEYEGESYAYLGDIDSYYWLRFARNIVDHGNICDEVINGVCYDKLALAPLGRPDSPNIHPYMIAGVYQISNFFGHDIDLMHASMITPTLIAIIVAIFAFLTGYIISGRIGGLLTSLLISFNMMYVQRSLGSDNDIYNLLFPMIILTFFFLAIRPQTKFKRILYSSLAGLFTGFFKFAWQSGWWNIFNTIIYSVIIYTCFILITTRRINLKKVLSKLSNIGIIFAIFYLTALFGYLIVGTVTEAPIAQFIEAPLEPISFIKFSKAAVNYNIWPNVKTTVAEFSPISVAQIPRYLYGSLGSLLYAFTLLGLSLIFINQIMPKKYKWYAMLGSFLCCLYLSSGFSMNQSPMSYIVAIGVISLSPLVYVLYNPRELNSQERRNIFIGIVILVWFLGTLFASTKGIRFVMLIVPAAALATGIAFSIIIKWILRLVDDFSRTRILAICVMVCLIAVIPMVLISETNKGTKSYMPSYNDAWDTSLKNIKNDSDTDVITGSWWDFGFYYKYTTERGMFLDGATQNNPPLHWLGKVLLTDDEEIATGILHMLSCGSNLAYDSIKNVTNDGPVSVDILNEIIVLDNNEAFGWLQQYGFSDSEINNIIQYTHCDAPDNYFIASDDMVGKAPVWGHFGSWDFYKSEVAAYSLVGKSKQEIIENITSRTTRKKGAYPDPERYYNELIVMGQGDINNWIAPWPRIGGQSQCNKAENSSLFVCNDGFRFNESSEECYIDSQGVKLYPQKCAYSYGNEVRIKYYTENLAVTNVNQNIGVSFIKTGNNTMATVSSDPVLAGSMFVRMYFYNGLGLEQFKLFDFQTTLTGTIIYTYKIKHDK